MSNEITHEEKLKEIVDYFKNNKKETLVQDWSDGMSTEYGFAGLTYIEIHQDLASRTKAHSVLKDYDGEEIVTIVDGIEATIEKSFDDELELLDKAYEDFTDSKPAIKVELKEEKKQKRKTKLRR